MNLFLKGISLLEGTTRNVRLFLFDTSIPDGQLKNVIILANFNTTAQNINPNFPSTGVWYNLMDNNSLNVTNTTDPISIPAGEFRIFGNEQTTLSNDDVSLINDQVRLYPNPVSNSFQLNSKVNSIVIYNLLGKVVKEFKGVFNEGKTFSIDNLETGVYMVRIQSEHGNILKKLLKK